MKYGILIHKYAKNIGDDIQSYAISQFMPRIDCMISREELASFKSEDDETVAAVFGGWFMWNKFRWPPSKQLFPLITGFHYYERNADLDTALRYDLPISRFEQFSGVGGAYLKDYGPVGCRDLSTLAMMKECGIDAYFSGCVTLTIQLKKDEGDRGDYAVIADLDEDVEDKVKKITENRIPLVKTTHILEAVPDATWDERKARVEKQLELYRRARYVVTTRLHVALPCLAMGVPVLLIERRMMHDPERFKPYDEWLHYYTHDEFMKDDFDLFDFENGTPNKDLHIETKNLMIGRIRDFFSYCMEHENEPPSFFNRLSYTDEEMIDWRIRYMARSLTRCREEGQEMLKTIHTLKGETLYPE